MRGQGRDRPGPDRHRQDGRVPPPVPEPLAAAQAQGADRPGHDADPRTGPAGRRRRPRSSPRAGGSAPSPVYGGAGMGRQLDGPRPRLRPRRRHAGPDARPPPPRVDVARPRPLRRPRRGRPDARHRVPPGHRADPAAAARSQRQTLLMSATVPDAIKRLVNRYMTNPIHLHMTPETLTVDKIRQIVLHGGRGEEVRPADEGDRAREAAAVPDLRRAEAVGGQPVPRAEARGAERGGDPRRPAAERSARRSWRRSAPARSST